MTLPAYGDEEEKQYFLWTIYFLDRGSLLASPNLDFIARPSLAQTRGRETQNYPKTNFGNSDYFKTVVPSSRVDRYVFETKISVHCSMVQVVA